MQSNHREARVGTTASGKWQGSAAVIFPISASIMLDTFPRRSLISSWTVPGKSSSLFIKRPAIIGDDSRPISCGPMFVIAPPVCSANPLLYYFLDGRWLTGGLWAGLDLNNFYFIFLLWQYLNVIFVWVTISNSMEVDNCDNLKVFELI